MADPAGRRREIRLLAALALTLAALAVWQLAAEAEADAPLPVAQAVRPPTSTALVAAERDTSVIVERPLFSPGRRRAGPIATAIAAEPPPPPPPAPLAKKFMLVGILVTDGRPRAMLREIAGNGRTLRLGAGDTLEAWTLAAIEPRRAVVFQRPGARETLRLAHPAGTVAIGNEASTDEDEDE